MSNLYSTEKYKRAAKRAQEMLSQMTLTEKIGQLSQFGTSIYSDNEQTYEDHFAEGKVGAYLTIKGAEKTNRIQRSLLKATRLPIPALFGDDVIHGFKTTFPTPFAQSCSWNPEMAEKCSAVAAKEAYRAGVKWTFSPMVDIARDPRWGRIAEGYGEDPYLCSRFSEAVVKGYQGEGEDSLGKDKIMACMKHFVAYGACIGGRDYNSADMSTQTLYDVYLPSFKAGIEAGAATVMSAFQDVNGVPASGSRYLLTDVLRGDLGFDGYVVSDAGSINELIPHGYAEDNKDAAYKGFNAGCDMLMHGDLYNNNLPKLLEEGKISIEQIDESVLRILTFKYMSGLMDDPYVDEEGEKCFFCDEHMELVLRSAEESAVLLENDGTLPLSADVERIALIGPLACDDEDARKHLLGCWSCMSEKERTVTLPEGLKKALPNAKIVTAKGCPLFEDPREAESFVDEDGLLREAIEAAKGCDVIIAALGEMARHSGEAASFAHLELPSPQKKLLDALIDTGKPVVLLVSSGRPLILTEYKDRVSALMMIWQMGTRAGDAIANLLSGKTNPSGHLSASFPVCEGQIPIYYSYNSTGRPVRNKWRFEAKYFDCQPEPLYPFGFGRSYTDFSYENITLSSDTMTANGSIDVTLTVRNTGKRDGATVVQLYVRDLIGSRVRPVKELKGFRKLCLAAGEAKEITLTLNADSLAFHNERMERVVEGGTFKLWVAEHAQDSSREFTFSVIN
ncbi:MAG: beta-glucosidase BglX [Clostridia bacterium]|nr:beta-glucosidase BglX [Clostridia bacterium]